MSLVARWHRVRSPFSEPGTVRGQRADGVVTQYDAAKGQGTVHATGTGKDYLVNASQARSVLTSGNLREGQQVTFVPFDGPRGSIAKHLWRGNFVDGSFPAFWPTGPVKSPAFPVLQWLPPSRRP
jgi:cold shock CspA family protein